MSADPPEPDFAPPTPPGVLPAEDLADVALPGADAAASLAAPVPVPGAAPSSARPRRRVVVVGAAIAAVLAVVVVAASVAASSAQRRAWEPVEADPLVSVEANAVQLVLGSCVERAPDDGAIDRVRVVPCVSEHEAQVVGRRDSSAQTVWPGHDGVVSHASAECGRQLLSAFGRQRSEGVRFVVWVPSEDSWAGGDRAGLCVALHDEPQAGSLLE
jgi:hypothetical protein